MFPHGTLVEEQKLPDRSDRQHDPRELARQLPQTLLSLRCRLVLPQKILEPDAAGVVVRLPLPNLGARFFGDPAPVSNGFLELLDLSLVQAVAFHLDEAVPPD